MSEVDVLIVGAGPVGMMAALSLQHAGLAVEVIDEAPRRTGHSYAVGLHPRSVLLLDRLAALDPLLPFAQRIDGVTLTGDGEERRLPLQGLPASHDWGLAVPQSRLEEVLEKALRKSGITIGWNERLRELDADPIHRWLPSTSWGATPAAAPSATRWSPATAGGCCGRGT